MLLSLLLSSLAMAVPLQLTHQGRLMDSEGSGLSGSHQLQFRLVDDSDFGSTVWVETMNVSFTNGYYSVILGADEENNPLDEMVFEQYPLWLELTVDEGTPMSPRHRLTSVPYAHIAGFAEVAGSAEIATTADVANSADVATMAVSLEGGSVNATEVQVNGSTVIDGAGNWVGTMPSVDFNTLTGVPTELTDGDDDTLASITCAVGEILAWGGSAWICASDNTLSETIVESMITNGAIDLAAGTTMAGLDVLTIGSDMDTLADIYCQDGEALVWDGLSGQWDCGISGDTLSGLNCTHGQVAKWNNANGVWDCGMDLDTDTTLGQSDVLNFVNGQTLSLGLGTQVNGANILTTQSTLTPNWNDIQGRPPGLEDGDDNTQLNQSEVLSYVSGQDIALGSGTTVGGNGVVTQPSVCGDSEVLIYSASTNGWVCGPDTDTTLTPQEMQAMIEVMSLNLQNVPQVNGADVLTTSSTLDPTLLDTSNAGANQVLSYDGTGVTWTEAPSSACTRNVISSDTYSYIEEVCPDGTSSLQATPSRTTTVQSFAKGQSTDHNCMIDGDDMIQCWGNDNQNQVSDAPNTTALKVAVYYNNSCAIMTNGAVECWGYDNNNQVSNAPSGSFTDISLGSGFACGIRDTGAVVCWGNDNNGQVSNTPAGVHTEIHASSNFACAIKADQSISCWGYNTNGQGTNQSGTYTQLVLGTNHACALKNDGNINCWGYNSSGSASDRSGNYVDVSVGSNNTCAVDNTGTITCWGNTSSIVGGAPIGTFTDVEVASTHACAIASDSSVECWGEAQYYNGTPSSGTFTSLDMNNSSTCGMLASGQYVCWGWDQSGSVSGANMGLSSSSVYTTTTRYNSDGTPYTTGSYYYGFCRNESDILLSAYCDRDVSVLQQPSSNNNYRWSARCFDTYSQPTLLCLSL